MSIDLRGVSVSSGDKKAIHLSCEYCGDDFWHSAQFTRYKLPVLIGMTMEHRRTCTEPSPDLKPRCNDCEAEFWYTPCTHEASA